MTKLFLVAALLLLNLASAFAAQSTLPPVTKHGVRNAIAVFRAQPTTQFGHVAAAMIFHFAETSPDTQVVISDKFTPWTAHKPYPKHTDELAIAYLAGTIRSQLEHGTRKNDPVAGAEQIIETYQQLRKAEPGFRDAYCEKLIDLKAKGKLKDYILSLDKA